MTTLEPLLRELIGGALRRRRLEHGRTLADVAGQAGVSMQHLSDVERGRKDASSEILAAICGALGVTAAELMSEAAQPAAQSAATPAARPAIRPSARPATRPILLDLTRTPRSAESELDTRSALSERHRLAAHPRGVMLSAA